MTAIEKPLVRRTAKLHVTSVSRIHYDPEPRSPYSVQSIPTLSGTLQYILTVPHLSVETKEGDQNFYLQKDAIFSDDILSGYTSYTEN